MRDTFNTNKLANFSVVLDHLETMFVSFSVGEKNYVIGNVYHPPISNNDEFMSDLSNFLKYALTGFPNYNFYTTDDFTYDFVFVQLKNRCKEFFFNIYFTWVFTTITRPNRVSSNSKTLIDSVLTYNIGAVKKSDVSVS